MPSGRCYLVHAIAPEETSAREVLLSPVRALRQMPKPAPANDAAPPALADLRAAER